MIALLEKNDAPGAQILQENVRRRFRDLPKQLSKGLADLHQLKQDFSSISGGTNA
jgi:hypothetical protein